jgi:hypothetical protein
MPGKTASRPPCRCRTIEGHLLPVSHAPPETQVIEGGANVWEQASVSPATPRRASRTVRHLNLADAIKSSQAG